MRTAMRFRRRLSRDVWRFELTYALSFYVIYASNEVTYALNAVFSSASSFYEVSSSA